MVNPSIIFEQGGVQWPHGTPPVLQSLLSKKGKEKFLIISKYEKLL